MGKLTKGNFIFVATERVPKERIQFGYSDMNMQYDFVLREYESVENEKKAEKLAADSDVVIIGSAPQKYYNIRVKNKKLTFLFSERLFKKGYMHMISPKAAHNIRTLYSAYKNYPIYLLCASAYTAFDYGFHGAFIDKSYKWGYFPPTIQYNIDELISNKDGLKHPDVSILWVGRLIGLKHPSAAVETAHYLSSRGYTFHLDIIGSGEKKIEKELEDQIKRYRLSDEVHLLGSMPQEDVRKHMEKADIFLFTSDFNEGWGAVLNESMNSGCAVIASHAIGSVPFLIKDGENGCIYKNGDQKMLNSVVEHLMKHPLIRKKLGKNAYDTLMRTWNAKVAAERLMKLSEQLLSSKGKKTSVEVYDKGPCSRAKRIPQWDMYRTCKYERKE